MSKRYHNWVDEEGKRTRGKGSCRNCGALRELRERKTLYANFVTGKGRFTMRLTMFYARNNTEPMTTSRLGCPP